MKYFYDTEFLEGPQDKRFLGITYGKTKPTIDLISIGIVAEDGREYYAISKDFNLDEAWNRFDIITGSPRSIGCSPDVKHYWIRENVLMPIFFELAMREFHDLHFKDEWCYEQEIVTLEVFKKHPKWTTNKNWFSKLIAKYGKSRQQIVQEIEKFLTINPNIMLASNPPKPKRENVELYGWYSAYDHVVFCWLFGLMKDLPNGFPMYTRDLKQISDELYLKNKKEYQENGGGNFIRKLSEHLNYPKETNAHNALADAKWNKQLYEFLINL